MNLLSHIFYLFPLSAAVCYRQTDVELFADFFFDIFGVWVNTPWADFLFFSIFEKALIFLF